MSKLDELIAKGRMLGGLEQELADALACAVEELALAWDEGRENGIRYMLTMNSEGPIPAARWAYDNPNPYYKGEERLACICHRETP